MHEVDLGLELAGISGWARIAKDLVLEDNRGFKEMVWSHSYHRNHCNTPECYI